MSDASSLRFRTVFLSDTHLGSRGCRATQLSRFLRRVECDRLYLVGDIVDMWRLRRKWYWPTEHNQVLRQLFALARSGTEVIFIPGNHDETARQFLNADFGGIRVLPYAIHHTATDRRLLVTHGDQFDLVVRHSRFISMIGAKAYEWLLRTNTVYNNVRIRLNLPQRSLSKAIKARVKSACMLISRFEESLMEDARQRGFHGVVCGHIHTPAHLEPDAAALSADPQAVAYYNCGDWVEGASAIVEHHDGSIHLLDAEAAFDVQPPRPAPRRGRPLEDVSLSLESLISAERIFAPRNDEAGLTFK